MRNHLISAGVSVFLFCSCGSDSPGNPSGSAGHTSASGGAGAVTAGASSVGQAGAATNVAGSSSGAGDVAGASAKAGSGGAPSTTNGGAAGVGGKPPGTAGSSTSSAGASGAPATGTCTRASLLAVVDAYQAAQTAGDKSKLPLASGAKLTENFKTVTKGIWETPLVIAHRFDLLDTATCQTFSEVYVTEGSPQYVIGLRLAVSGSQISEIESIVTMGTVSGSTITSNDWNFDAKAYMTCAKSEDWSVVPEAQRNTREELIAAGEAYFKIFSDKDTVVPWGTPCYRLEGGKGCTPAADKASKTCNVGVPDGINFKNTHWVVDLELNTSVGLTLFAGAAPDSHMFRLISGKIVKVHTLTQGTGGGTP